MAANQDRITGNVWLTRSTQSGLVTTQKTEARLLSDALSPADTEWATDLITANVGQENCGDQLGEFELSAIG